MSVVRIRFVRSSEKVDDDDDEKEAEGSLLPFSEQNEEQLKCVGDQLKGIGIPNKNNSYFYKNKQTNNKIAWMERPPCVWEVIGSIPVGDLDFFFVPRS